MSVSRQKSRSERAKPSIFWVLASLVLPIVTAMTRFQIIDGEKLPRTGPCIIAPNHYSEIDPVMIGVVVWKHGRLPRFLAKESLFRVPVVGWFLRASGQVPVTRERHVRGNDSLDQAQKIVNDGRVVIIYPEGTLTRDPDLWPMKGRNGAARMALESKIPVIPVAHWGTQDIMGRYSKKISFFPRKTIRVAFGDPVDLSAFYGRGMDTATLNEATSLIMSAITSLLEGLRDQHAPEVRWNPAQHGQNRTGRIDG